MNVTEFSHKLADVNPQVTWPSIAADYIYDFTSDSMPKNGDFMNIGSMFHDYLCRYIKRKPVPEAFLRSCESVYNVLYILGFTAVNCEEAVSGLGVDGRIDLHGVDQRDLHWIIELKCTYGDHLKPPTTREIFQMVLYSRLLNLTQTPGIMCIRVNLRMRKIGVYRLYDYKPWIDLIPLKVA